MVETVIGWLDKQIENKRIILLDLKGELANARNKALETNKIYDWNKHGDIKRIVLKTSGELTAYNSLKVLLKDSNVLCIKCKGENRYD